MFIDFPTHSSGTQPDLILSNQPDLVCDVESVCNLGNSDHAMIMLTVLGSIPSNITYEAVPDWRKADYNVLVKELSMTMFYRIWIP